MSALFDRCFDRLIGHEAGHANDPNDPGGETKWGISKRTYPKLSIVDLTRDQAKEIYRGDFWGRGRMDELPPALGLRELRREMRPRQAGQM